MGGTGARQGGASGTEAWCFGCQRAAGDWLEVCGGVCDWGEAVLSWFPASVFEAPVGEVCGCFRESAEERWAADPSHREDQRESNEGLLLRMMREHYPQSGSGGGRNEESVEAIGDVYLDHVGGTETAVRSPYLSKHPF